MMQVLVLHDTVERVRSACGDVSLQSQQQQATTVVTSTEQALQLLVRVVGNTPPGELRAALMPYANECIAVSQFFGTHASSKSHQRCPWDQIQWQSRAATLQQNSTELTQRLSEIIT
jgi:hypothetical protein